jgi:hypothetical protein
MDKVGVAVGTVVVDDFDIKFFDRNHLVIGVERESGTVVEPVDRFREVLVHDIVVWAMAVVTTGNTRMGRVPPGVKLVLHDMAVGTGTGVARKIRQPFRLCECENRETYHKKKHA